MKKIIPLMLLASTALADDNCVLQERTVTTNSTVILERSTIRRDVVPYGANQKKCIVDFRVRIKGEWYTAFGEHIWSGDTPSSQACAVAVNRAEADAISRVARSSVTNERTLVCKDRPELKTLRNSQIGTVGDAGQFRPHPDYPKRFYHNGVQCRWFVEPSFTGNDVRMFQGVVCEVQDQKWVVVDKF